VSSSLRRTQPNTLHYHHQSLDLVMEDLCVANHANNSCNNLGHRDRTSSRRKIQHGSTFHPCSCIFLHRRVWHVCGEVSMLVFKLLSSTWCMHLNSGLVGCVDSLLVNPNSLLFAWMTTCYEWHHA